MCSQAWAGRVPIKFKKMNKLIVVMTKLNEISVYLPTLVLVGRQLWNRFVGLWAHVTISFVWMALDYINTNLVGFDAKSVVNPWPTRVIFNFIYYSVSLLVGCNGASPGWQITGILNSLILPLKKSHRSKPKSDAPQFLLAPIRKYC